MEKSQSRYNQRGVSSSKEEVHQVVDQMDRGVFPGAFCKITEDALTEKMSVAMSFTLMVQAQNQFSDTFGIAKRETLPFLRDCSRQPGHES